jgi:hypothetical protein
MVVIGVMRGSFIITFIGFCVYGEINTSDTTRSHDGGYIRGVVSVALNDRPWIPSSTLYVKFISRSYAFNVELAYNCELNP